MLLVTNIGILNHILKDYKFELYNNVKFLATLIFKEYQLIVQLTVLLHTYCTASYYLCNN